MAEKTKYTIVKPVAGYKHGEIIEVEKLPLALQAHVIKTPEGSVSSGSDDKAENEKLKADLADSLKEVESIKAENEKLKAEVEDLKKAPELTLEPATQPKKK